MANYEKYMDEEDFYEGKFGGAPRSQKISKKKSKTEEGSVKKDNDKSNKFDKKNAQKAPWKNDF